MKRASATTTILDVVDDVQLFKRWFKRPETWRSWRVFLSVLFGLPLAADDLELFQQCTGLDAPPPGGFLEAWLVCGRRSGKSFILALVAVFLAVFKDWSPYLAPGERGTIRIVACDRRQARVIYRYCRALLQNVPVIAAMVEREAPGDGEIDLTNSISIEVQTASFRTIRGYTIICALLDEVAFWWGEDTASPDVEILAALRPAMSTVPGAMLLAASSPYSHKGALWEAYKQHWGQSDPVLVWQADTRTMNPTVPQRIIDEAYERDPANAAAEYGAEFRQDIAGFLDCALIDAAVDTGVTVRPPLDGVSYRCHCDPSGGSRDSFAAAIVHREADTVIVDAVHETRAPFNPASAVGEIADLLRSYRISSVSGDKYAARFVIEAFAREGVTYTHAPSDTSSLYMDALPCFTSGQVRLVDNPRLIAQLTQLERRSGTTGRDRVDHPVGSHDDVAAAACGAIALASRPQQSALIPSLLSGPVYLGPAFPEFSGDGSAAANYAAYLASRGEGYY